MQNHHNIFVTRCTHAQLCPTLCNPVDWSLPGSSVHGILQARLLEWVAIPFSRGSSRPKDRTHIPCISHTGRQILYHWQTREMDLICLKEKEAWTWWQLCKASGRKVRPFADPINVILTSYTSQSSSSGPKQPGWSPGPIITQASTTFQEGEVISPCLFLVFRQGTSLELAECTVSAERWVLSAAPISQSLLPFVSMHCLCVNTEISLSIPQRGTALGMLNRPQRKHTIIFNERRTMRSGPVT